MASTSAALRLAGVQHVERAFRHLGEDGHLHRQVGLDDRSEAVLSVDQGAGGVKRDALVGDPPFAAAHRRGEVAYRALRQRPVGRVALQVLGGLGRRYGLHPATHDDLNPLRGAGCRWRQPVRLQEA
jgi:hypothetical protein